LSLSVSTISLAGPALAVAADNPAGKCMTCHEDKSPGLYKQWFTSKHGAAGVTCIDCHGAGDGEPDGYMHEGALIATLVTRWPSPAARAATARRW
jgi:hydroxylamine dehydrogenase